MGEIASVELPQDSGGADRQPEKLLKVEASPEGFLSETPLKSSEDQGKPVITLDDVEHLNHAADVGRSHEPSSCLNRLTSAGEGFSVFRALTMTVSEVSSFHCPVDRPVEGIVDLLVIV